MTMLRSMHRLPMIDGLFTRMRWRTVASIAIVVLTCCMALGTASPTMAQGGDNDADGLPNGQEGKHGTDRTNPDTDGDGLLDGDEVFVHVTNPTLRDSDYDWLSDGDEIGRGTDPLDADTDNDQLKDGVEVHVHFTNPRTQDTDGDGLTDFFEIYWSYTNPNDRDTDNDNFHDGIDRYPLDSMRS